MLELLSLLKEFHGLLSSGTDSLRSVAKYFERTNRAIDDIIREIKNLSTSVDLLCESVDKIPETMIALKMKGHEYEGRGHVISAYKALKAGVIDDARIELDNAKALAVTNWSLWIGYVWLHFLESTQSHKSYNTVDNYTPTLQEKRDALEKAARYVNSETDELDINSRLSLLFTISGIIQVYGIDDLLPYPLEYIFKNILSEESYPTKRKLELVSPLKEQVMKIENARMKILYYKVVDSYFQEIVSQKTIQISNFTLGSYERHFTGIQNLLIRMRSNASEIAIKRAITLFSELNIKMFQAIKSELQSLTIDADIFEKIVQIVTEINAILALPEENFDKKLLSDLQEKRQQVSTKVCKILEKKISMTDQWSHAYFETLQSDLLSCQDFLKKNTSNFSNNAFDIVHHLLIDAKRLYEENLNNLKEIELLEYKVGEKKFGLDKFKSFFCYLGFLIIIIVSIIAGVYFMLSEGTGNLIAMILEGCFFAGLIALILLGIGWVAYIVIFSPSNFIYKLLNKRGIEKLEEIKTEKIKEKAIIETEIQKFLIQLKG